MSINANATQLVNICCDQAHELLRSAGEFYPFAFGFSAQNRVIPVMNYFGEEFPTSLQVLTNLQKALAVSHQKYDFSEVAICSNVRWRDHITQELHDAIQICVDSIHTANQFDFYQSYSLGEKIDYATPVVEHGTLSFFSGINQKSIK